ncbi:MAG: 30S ribosomal protein S1 [Phycisphaerae bacterium]|nr:30S ribosomal protein S1 [Phycisphaerae bacterium]
MVNQNLINELDITDASLDNELTAAFGEGADWTTIADEIDRSVNQFQPNNVLTGRIVNVIGDDVVVDVGLKSEGVIGRNEFADPSAIDIGDEVQVWLETVESDSGVIVLSKRKADRILNWQRIIETSKEGDVVKGRVTRKIKGGLLVDIGVPVFLPASQVDTRRPADVAEYIGQEIEAKILKIDTDRRNIVISRRKLIEEKRTAQKTKLLAEIEVGQIRRGVVKNLADFGAFIDLGGIDGLLHITDMSWDRVGHPSEMLNIDQEVDIKILNVDKEKEKIALGIKQLHENPWEKIEDRYPVDTRVQGEVVNIMNYGAFVKLEPGVEGLVHISEMSWTRRINHPSEVIKPGDMIEVVVLEINKGKQEISLGMKQTETNPWMKVAEKYPPNTIIKGRVRNLANYGAFVEIEEGIDGLLHVSDMSWTKKISHPNEVVKKGDTVECVVLSVDQEKMRVALGLKQLHEDPWLRAVPEKYQSGMIVKGTVTKITNFGVFVELEPDLEGLLHVSELADHKVDDPHSVVKISEEIEVKILRVDVNERKIGLSKKRAEWAAAGEEGEEGRGEARARPRRGGLVGPGTDSAIFGEPLFIKPTAPPGSASTDAETIAPAEESDAESKSEVDDDAGDADTESKSEPNDDAGDAEEK